MPWLVDICPCPQHGARWRSLFVRRSGRRARKRWVTRIYSESYTTLRRWRAMPDTASSSAFHMPASPLSTSRMTASVSTSSFSLEPPMENGCGSCGASRRRIERRLYCMRTCLPPISSDRRRQGAGGCRTHGIAVRRTQLKSQSREPPRPAALASEASRPARLVVRSIRTRSP